MKRIVISLALALGLALPLVVTAVKPNDFTATVTVSPAAPAYGDLITLTATTDATGTAIVMICTHEFGQTYSFSVINYTGGTYSDDVGLYAPNWPSGGATCVADVNLYTRNGNSYQYKTTVIGSLTFSVVP